MKRPRRRSFWLPGFAGFALIPCLSSCGDDCPDLKYVPGERYRVVVVERIPWIPESECGYLTLGDEFTVTVFGTSTSVLERTGCSRAVIAPEIPSFLPEDEHWECGAGFQPGCSSPKGSLTFLLVGLSPSAAPNEDVELTLNGPNACTDKFRVQVVWEDR